MMCAVSSTKCWPPPKNCNRSCPAEGRPHNQRIYRAIRSILREDSGCEDVMQEAYVRAYEHLAQFEGRSQFSTWLTRIAINEALKRLNARGKLDTLDKEQFGLLFQEMLRDFASVRSR